MPEQEVTEPRRVKAFARFFKNYMSVSALVTAALPIPVTALKLIPTYHAQTSILSVYTSLFCFLLLGFIFYSRHHLARFMFPEISGARNVFWSGFLAILPALLIASSLSCVYLYHTSLDMSVARVLSSTRFERAQSPTSSYSQSPSPLTNANEIQQPKVTPIKRDQVLDQLESQDIPMAGQVFALYLGIFLFAESAFILMAIKEYLQDLVKISEIDLIVGPSRAPTT
jgi:hypothetical protein